MSKLLQSILIAVVVLIFAATQYFDTPSETVNSDRSSAHRYSSDGDLKNAFESKRSNIQVHGQGRVQRLLTDDNKGSRHQRFILLMDSGQSILVAHNIDIADKITNLQPNDLVEFYGVYEWNPQGGVIHWTHHDPRRSHIDGWLKHGGKIYQ